MVKSPLFRGERTIERTYLSVVSGERKGVLATLLRALLSIASLFYGLAILVRRALYGIGLKRQARAACPVLSVGNLVAGGTGKTPMVEHLARRMLARGRRPAVVARGYKARTPGAANDEALVLGANLPGVPVVIEPVRPRGTATAVERHGADAVILDDGFQHWPIARDLDLVLIDALEPFGHGRLLPRGLLREPRSALARADAVAITRADLVSAARLAEIRAAVRAIRSDAVLLEVVEEAVGVERVPGAGAVAGAVAGAAGVAGRRVVAFCGIGNPEGFFRRLGAMGAEVVARKAFDDHHHYEAAELVALAREAKAAGADLVTTQKDAVKLTDLEGAESVYVVKIRAAIRAGEADLERLIDRALERAAAAAPEAAPGARLAFA